MKLKLLCSVLFVFGLLAAQSKYTNPIVKDDVVFDEKDGILAVEAEFFYKQSKSEVRQWYRISKNELPKVGRDDDGPHVKGASNNAYLEIQPDSRVTHGDPLVEFENFSNEAGKLALLHYKVNVNTPGRYYVWVRAYSTGSEDNGIHVGLNGEWPSTGKRMQWCKGKQQWTWESKQRTKEVHCGVPWLIYLDIDKAGEHEIMFSMREDGFEFDKFVLAKDTSFRPEGVGPEVIVKKGTLPAPYAVVEKDKEVTPTFPTMAEKSVPKTKVMRAINFPYKDNAFYNNDNKWLAINPKENKEAETSMKFPFPDNMYDIVFLAVGENDGRSKYTVYVNDEEIGQFIAPLSKAAFEEGKNFCELWENIDLKKGDIIKVKARVGMHNGEYSRGRWSGIAFAEMTKGKEVLKNVGHLWASAGGPTVRGNQPAHKKLQKLPEPELEFSDINERGPDGEGNVTMSGELKQWHKVTLTMDGPFAHELDTDPNPFTDYNMTVEFVHESGAPSYKIPGYFAADGDAGNTSADKGNKWRAHLSPDKTGKWFYKVSFKKGAMVAVIDVPWSNELEPYNGVKGEFVIGANDKTGKDFRSKGRLEYVGKHHLQFQGSKEYFLKAGADAPETFLAYDEFDATYTVRTAMKSWKPHASDYKEGDPTWAGGKGKNIIGAVNYLSDKGVNVYSFLTYNAGGDGDNVWPFVKRSAKFHYDCSKLDQWGIVFDHSQAKGVYLHFKTQETENDDNRRGKKGNKQRIVESLDGGDLGPERRLYYRELIARYSYLLALNWNMGEENTQSEKQRRAMINHMAKLCPYNQNIVLHTFPGQQKSYTPLLGKEGSLLTGVSLQNEWDDVHHRTLQWVKASAEAGRPWVVANDEQGSAGTGVPPDHGYKGFDAEKLGYDNNDTRKQTLWGNIMAGGAGAEYYFGYKLPENDIKCEDFRSRDKSWDYARVALDFFSDYAVPFWEMTNKNELIANPEGNKEKYCFAKEGEIYLVYLGYTQTSTLDLSAAEGSYTVMWYNTRTGGKLLKGSVKKVTGGSTVELGNAPSDPDEDWLVIIKKK